ncbi:hypothetical protein [Aureimonas psammosilenae]|uniref:hypothetical protein n=1 Tax=Aureimonas psammosilenae TaxID=2495496 RepID=UPI001260F1CB|nr:hypothetical protein [Aureimonas psammosilenae]
MRLILATLPLVLATAPIAAADEPDRYSGRYAAPCGDLLVCELDIRPARGGWTIRWTAIDQRDHDLKPKCSFTVKAEIGSAAMGATGVVTGIAVGTVRGKPFGLFDLGDGRVSWSSTWYACRGIAPKGIYSLFGDEYRDS